MTFHRRVATLMFTLVVVAGCAQTTVSDRQYYEGKRVARPNRIIVYDFAGSAADVPAGSQTAGMYAPPATTPSPEESAIARKLGAQVATELVAEIQQMGLPAVRAVGQPPAQPGDLVLMGYFEAIDQGSAVKRVALGFGSGDAALQTRVEGYLMTERGLRLVASGDVDSAGNKTPGVAVPLVAAVATGNPIGLIVGTAVKVGGEVTNETTIQGSAKRTAQEIGDQLRPAFQRQGWI